MRYFYYPWEFESTGQAIETLHNAKKLDEAGVIFKKAIKITASRRHKTQHA